jgi:hypothetical protein
MSPLEELDGPLVLLGFPSGVESPQIAAFSGLGIDLPRIKPVVT